MNSLDLEDIIYNNYFKDYDKKEIYNILIELNKNIYTNEKEFTKTLRTIIKGYKKYFLNASEGNICVFENFIGKPKKNLSKMCDILEIDYDNNYLHKLKYVNFYKILEII